ncbi:MAG TPA: hypothetical protein VF972_08030 [Actinomycetota bacterium]
MSPPPDDRDDRISRITNILREVAQTHHTVYRITDGTDPDWPSWYAEWLVTLSELPGVVGMKPTRTELTWLLVELDKEYTASDQADPWEDVYARRIVAHFDREGGRA